MAVTEPVPFRTYDEPLVGTRFRDCEHGTTGTTVGRAYDAPYGGDLNPLVPVQYDHLFDQVIESLGSLTLIPADPVRQASAARGRMVAEQYDRCESLARLLTDLHAYADTLGPEAWGNNVHIANIRNKKD